MRLVLYYRQTAQKSGGERWGRGGGGRKGVVCARAYWSPPPPPPLPSLHASNPLLFSQWQQQLPHLLLARTIGIHNMCGRVAYRDPHDELVVWWY